MRPRLRATLGLTLALLLGAVAACGRVGPPVRSQPAAAPAATVEPASASEPVPPQSQPDSEEKNP